MYIPWWGVIAILVVLIILWGVYGIMIGNLSNRVDNLEEKEDEDKRPDFDE